MIREEDKVTRSSKSTAAPILPLHTNCSNTYQQQAGAYDESQVYQGYYEGQEGYENYEQAGAGEYANYDYYQSQDG